jgi:hypothetical protein
MSLYWQIDAELVYNNSRRPDVCVGETASPCSGLPPTMDIYTEKYIPLHIIALRFVQPIVGSEE